MITIHEHQTLKPLVFDKVKHVSNLWNWDFRSNTFEEFEYDDGFDDGQQLYNEEVEYHINGLGNVTAYYSIIHSWFISFNAGDCDTPPSSEIVHEDVELCVEDIYFDFDIELSNREDDDICDRLSHLVELSLH